MSLDFTSALKKFSTKLSSIKTAKSADTTIKFNKGLIVLLILVVLILAVLMSAFIYLSEAAEPEALSESELRSIIYAIDGLEWKCSKADRSTIEALFGVTSAGCMQTERVTSETFVMTLDDVWQFDVVISDQGCFLILAGAEEYPLYYSEDTALVLLWEDFTITWELE